MKKRIVRVVKTKKKRAWKWLRKRRDHTPKNEAFAEDPMVPSHVYMAPIAPNFARVMYSAHLLASGWSELDATVVLCKKYKIRPRMASNYTRRARAVLRDTTRLSFEDLRATATATYMQILRTAKTPTEKIAAQTRIDRLYGLEMATPMAIQISTPNSDERDRMKKLADVIFKDPSAREHLLELQKRISFEPIDRRDAEVISADFTGPHGSVPDEGEVSDTATHRVLESKTNGCS